MKLLKSIGKVVVVLLISLLCSRFIHNNIIFKASVEGQSMYPAYQEGDLVYVLKIGKIKRGDVVVALENNKLIIKRCIAIPWDMIRIREGVVNLNGTSLVEPYTTGYTDSGLYYHYKSLGDDDYFLLGDNRSISNDSRSFGFVHRAKILGKVIYKKEKR